MADNYIDEDQEKNLVQLCVFFTTGKNGREVNAALYSADERKFMLTEFQDN